MVRTFMILTTALLGLASLGLAPAPLPAAAPADAGAGSPRLAAAIADIVEPYVRSRDFAGVIGIGRDGEPPRLYAFGLASPELETEHRSDGIFMIGSVSKQFTAAAILLLEEDGRLATGDPASRHLPGLGLDERVTIEQLLTHTSGVADVYSLERFGATAGRAGSFDAVLADLARAPLGHEPGSAWAYSNGGYSLLAAIVERVSGVSYGDFLERRIFAPLGMTSSAHDAPGPVVAGRVPGYDPWGRDELTPAAPIAPAFSIGSGSLWSSAGDLIRWSEALHGGKLLSPASYTKLTTPHANGYGYGVSVFRRFGRNVIGHDGRVAGYSSDLARYVDERTTVLVLANVQSVARDEIRRPVAAAVFGEEVQEPETRTFAAAPPAALDELVGVYSFGPGFEVSISVDGGRLLARANQGGFSELVPLAGGEWFSRMLWATVRFARDESGAVERLLWGRGAGAPAGTRVP